jgi:hypothetical protein
MTKEQILDVIKMLSRLESWTWSCDKHLPDWVEQELDTMIGVLSRELLK